MTPLVPHQPQQMLSLITELARARKEVETNSARILDLETALAREKKARTLAETRAAQLEAAVASIQQPPPPPAPDAAAAAAAEEFQSRMTEILAELDSVKAEMTEYRRTAEARAEALDADKMTLLETIRAIRVKEDQRRERVVEAGAQTEEPGTADEGVQVRPVSAASSMRGSLVVRRKEKEGKRAAGVAVVPYASLIGVVVIGVGLMAVINNWQRGER